MAVRIERAEITGLAEALQFLDHIEKELKEPRDGLIKATHGVAGQWRSNFEAEGGQYRRWKALSERTQEERARQGYGSAHPILRRRGSLLSTAIEFFEQVNDDSSRSGDRVAASYTLSGDTATLSLSGSKATNQTGGARLPARPFWYSEGKAVTAARLATEAWLMEKFND